MPKKDFPALTGIRFIAATLVFLCHYPVLIISQQDSVFFSLFRQLNIGVTIFFVLSGFLITHRYFEYSFSLKQWGHYFIKRFARIFPLYIFILSIQFLLLARQNKVDNFLLLAFFNATLIKGLSEKYALTGISQSWSLTVEEMFYFFAPLSFYLIKVRKIFFVQIPVLLLVGSLAVSLFLVWPWEGFFANFRFMFSTTFFGRCFEFFAGIFVALLVINKKSTHQTFKQYTLIGGLFFCALLAIATFYGYTNKIEFMNKTAVGIVLLNFIFPVSIAIFYFGLIHEQTWIRRFLSAVPIVLLGKSSYAFYLIHFGMIAETILFHISSNVLVLYILLQFLSIVLYKGYEKPVYFFILRKSRVKPG